MARKENAYYLWHIYFLYQFIPQVHLLFLWIYSSDNCLGQNMKYVGLIGRDLFVPVSWVLRSLTWCPTELSVGCQMSQAFCSHMKLLNV